MYFYYIQIRTEFYYVPTVPKNANNSQDYSIIPAKFYIFRCAINLLSTLSIDFVSISTFL